MPQERTPAPLDLKYWYIDKDMNQYEIAKKFGVSQSLVCKWLRRSKIFRTPGFRKTSRFSTRCPKASISPSILDLAWAAGFIEGEGTFLRHVHTKRPHKQPGSILAVSQVNKEPLEKLQRMFGGNIRRINQDVKKNHKNSYFRLSLHGARARGVALTIYSFLSQRRQSQVRRMM